MRLPGWHLALLLATAALACGSSSSGDPGDSGGSRGAADAGAITFPESFVFGTAIAGFQADMGCPTVPAAQCADPHSDWYAFTTSPTTVNDPSCYLSGQDPAVVGPGFWELYDADAQRASDELHNGALRLSIEWSRLFPTATDAAQGYDALKQLADPQALAGYHAIFAALKKHGLKPLVTLQHYTLPGWLHDAVGCHTDFASCSPRGWVDSARAVAEAAKYAGFVGQEFGGEVDWWATVNEPLQNMVFGYLEPNAQRSQPPAVSLQSAAAKTVLNALIDAHARMYDALKRADTVDADGDGVASWVGVVYPLVPVAPANPGSAADQTAAKNLDYLWNRVYLNAVVLGKYDANLDGNTTTRADLAGRMDYVGINWYGGLRVSGLPVSILPGLSPLFTASPNLVTTDNQPDKLAAFLHYVNVDLGKPAVITENGAGADGNTPGFLIANLQAVGRAIAAGADVRGYFYWTLTDNYEWNHGMDIRMGLYAVDKGDPTKTRTARPAASVYGTIAESRSIPGSLAAAWPVDGGLSD